MHLIEDIVAWAAGWIVAVISATSYAGVAVLMAIESACVPLPSEIIMPFAGYLVSLGEMSLIGAATAGALGCNIGSVLAYEIGKHGGRRAVRRFGRYVFMNERDLDWAEGFFARWGSAAVFVCRLLPVVRSFIAFPAGVARMPLWKFHIYTFLGSWPWCFGLAWIGMTLGDRWQSDPRMRAVLHRLDVLVVAAVLLALAWFAWHRLRGRPKSRAEEKSR